MKIKTVDFINEEMILIDQRKLPVEKVFFKTKNYKEGIFAISDMIVRGAPAIGIVGAYTVYLAAKEFENIDKNDFFYKMNLACKEISKARPTAVNLMWAVKEQKKIIKKYENQDISFICKKLLENANEIKKEDIKINKNIGNYGNELIDKNATILTHCNAGALATAGYGTAIGVIRSAHLSGKNIKVFADETRPRLQGARLTAFELVEEGIPATLISDSVAATLIRDKKIDLIVVGADRIASNGDTANKIGTYMLSEIAKKFEIPMYIAAPISTIDFDIKNGKEIIIEERDKSEITHIKGVQIAPKEIDVYNPAFDVTPAENITAIITEKGILYPPFEESISKLMKK
ncbi:methylthioribose-1-phosphate isomerase [Oceanotoga teriensis]|uniref:Methylthioribose-1-phosphate isomerase n=1 Tax=Oceanotoga teriensis TaxID=515440 RepID=A0AA45HHI7_9BACT|nr:S-methyl-5-thioribose-1-phosphate isomerase [Oceanotoga teriensis]PWJ84719.1 methylthioribose-1-phosphate isomerase [Oceanotoga teriensis]